MRGADGRFVIAVPARCGAITCRLYGRTQRCPWRRICTGACNFARYGYTTSFSQPHQPNGGLSILSGNLGQAVIKISAVDPTYHRITAPAAVFDNEADVKKAFKEDG